MDEIISLLCSHFPELSSKWQHLDKDIKKELRDQAEDKFIQSELEEILFIDSDVFSLNLILKTCIQFVSSMYTCIRNLDDPHVEKQEEKLKQFYLTLLTQLGDIGKQSSKVFTNLDVISTSNYERICELKAADFQKKNEHFVNSALRSTLNYQNEIKECLAYQVNGNHLFLFFFFS